MTKNRIFLYLLFVFGIFYIERIISLKVDSLELRISHLKELVHFRETGKWPTVKNPNLSQFHRRIFLCGEISEEEGGKLTLELIPFKTLRIWYGANSFLKINQRPDEEWTYLLRDDHLQSENEALRRGVLFQDDQSLFLVGAGLLLSSEYCLSQ